MDKPLSHIDNNQNTDQKQVESVKDAHAPIGAYNPELSTAKWEKQVQWNATPQGRAAIRLFSRGVLGAATFALGGWYISGQGGGITGYKFNFQAENKLLEMFKASEGAFDRKKPLHYIARIMDHVAGRPIYTFLKEIGVAHPENWVKFRPTTAPSNSRQPGRSLGAEAVGITFDFFSASIGDAFGRDLADNLDPNNKHKFWKDKHGHASLRAELSNIGKALWRYVTLNGGEDWAVAIPYAYYLRGQRALINHFSPGFGYDSDRAVNGAAFKYDGKHVTGNYNLEGMLDLQGRFTAYNIGTLMYRELYNHIGNRLRGCDSSLYGAPDHRTQKHPGLTDELEYFMKWGARSLIKGGLYMTPAVPFFSIFRTSQTKYKALFIDPETGGVLSYKGHDNINDGVFANELNRVNPDGSPAFKVDTEVFFDKFNKDTGKFERIAKEAHNPLPLNSFRQSKNIIGKGFGYMGEAQNWLRSRVNDWPEKIDRHQYPTLAKVLTKRTADRYVNAMFAYTPYMYVKGEAARWFDNGKTDSALERMIDGADKLNLHEFKEGFGEVWRAAIHKPFKDAAREAEGERRRAIDTSEADDVTREQAKKLHDRQRLGYGMQLPWQQRLFKGEEKEHTGHYDRPPTPEDMEAIKQASREKPSWQQQVGKGREAAFANYAEQEEMRRVLQEAAPPTNSVH